MEVKSCDADAIFRVFTACPTDTKALILDVRPHKDFKKLHVNQAFCVRLSSNGKVLLDYSQAQYDFKWSQDCWWSKPVFVYGESSLKRDHPVVDFLAKEGRCSELYYYKDGFNEFEKLFPFLCTSSVKGGGIKKYPSQIIPGLLFLGDWNNAEAFDRLAEINVKRIITIHNHPENLRPPPHIKHLKFELPDVDTVDISPCFSQAYEFIEEARLKGHAVLVHCGAGVSRSAAICMMYLMRRNLWSAQKAKAHCVLRRSLVCPNDGFWRTLCALEGTLGIAERSDPTATSGFHGDDADVKLSEDAAGEKVQVRMRPANDLKRGRDEEDKASGPVSSSGRKSDSYSLVFDVSKPEGLVGKLEVGPMRFHQRCVFGRQPSCDVVLEHLSISRQHAQLTVDGAGSVFVTDLKSGHGTKVGDAWIRPNVPKPLPVGAVVSFGASTRRYKLVAVTNGEAASTKR